MMRRIKSPLTKLFESWDHQKLISDEEAKKCLAPLICERMEGRDETIWIQRTDDLTKIWFMDRWKKV